MIDITNNLIAYYPCNLNTDDESGNNNHGMNHNVNFIADKNGIPNSACEFNGQDSYIEILTSPLLEIGYNDYTITAWVKPYSIRMERIFSKGSCRGIDGYMLRTTSENEVFSENTYLGTLRIYFAGENNLEINTWNFITTVVDRNIGGKIYVNGILDTSQIYNTSNFDFSNNRNPIIGYNDVYKNEPFDCTKEAFHGAIDEIRIYNRALTQSEIQALYNALNPNCLTIKNIEFAGVGDLDRDNEELELEITSGEKTYDCGLFKSSMINNKKSHRFDLSITCENDEFVKIMFIERDYCNDDYKAEALKCLPTTSLQMLETTIQPDNTVLGTSHCEGHESGSEACITFGGKKVGGSFCGFHAWSTEDCVYRERQETDSSYYLTYEITQGACTNDLSYNDDEYVCKVEAHKPSPICSDFDSSAVAYGNTLTQVLVGATGLLLVEVLF